eukprot:7478382-Lingulodinium_polyedra.AAC.1
MAPADDLDVDVVDVGAKAAPGNGVVEVVEQPMQVGPCHVVAGARTSQDAPANEHGWRHDAISNNGPRGPMQLE